MNRSVKIITWLVGFLLFANTIYSQYRFDQPVLINKENGLPSNTARSIRKDERGFIWIATSEGLCRFDGMETKNYSTGPDPRTSLFDKSLNAVLPVGKEIWVGSGQGVSVLSTETETFRHYQFDENGKAKDVSRRFDQMIAFLYKDKQGDIWVGTRDRGALMYDRKNDNFIKFKYPKEAYRPIVPSLGTNNAVLCITASPVNDSIIWVGTTAGLEKINKFNGKVTWYTFPNENKQYQVALNAFRRVLAHTNGLLYEGSWEAGVNVFDPVNETFTPLEVIDSPGKSLLDGVISNIHQKSENEIWITTSRGLAIYNISKKAVTWYKKNYPPLFKFYGIEFIDERNRVWQTVINGVQYFDPVAQQFSTYTFENLYTGDWAFVFNIKTDPSGNQVTVCPMIADAIYRFDKPSGEWSRFPFDFKSLGLNKFTVRGFEEIKPGHYVISADEGLFEFSFVDKKLRRSLINPKVLFKRWGDINKDRNGNLWINANEEGLIKWELKTGRYRIISKELARDGGSGIVGRSSRMYEDSKGNIWFSRFGGFSVYLSAYDSVLNFIYEKDHEKSLPGVNSFAEDKDGRLWTCSRDGLYGYINVNNPEKGVVGKFQLGNAGIKGHIFDLSTDKEGYVWAYTDIQLLRLQEDPKRIFKVDFAYGAAPVDFFHFSFLPGGEMIFGGRNSITIADPYSFSRNTEVPVPYLTGIQVMNQPASELLLENKLKLGARQNFFSISFSAIAFTMPEAVKFRYRLKGFDNWSETNERRFANYTNVPSGDYDFELQVANNEGVWNTFNLAVPIHIATPWWQTLFFKIAVVLFTAFVIYFVYRYRIEQVRKKEKLKAQYEKKLANVEMSALLAQMNPHFLFNSLNSIDSYIIRNESRKASEYLNNFARLMRLILQNSRSNYISLKDELEALDLYLQMESLRFGNRFAYEIITEEGIDASSILIPPMLIQPYVENAIWHGLMHRNNGIQGKVEIKISKKDEKLICIIEDNGIGREKALELRAQKTSARKRSMGMQITQDRIDMINKLYDTNTRVRIIDLKDNKGEATGTKVELTIPV